MPRVVHFEVYADDVDRAIKFYSDVFGWKAEKWDGPVDYWMLTTGEEGHPGINGGLMQRPEPGAIPNNHIDVPSVDEYASKITSNGGTVVAPKMSIKGVGYAAMCKDTEGIGFGIIEFDRSAT